MAQHDYVLENASGALFRQDLNNVLRAIAENNMGATAPTTTYAGMWWLDISTNPATLRIRNNANTAWISCGNLNEMSYLAGVTSAIQAQLNAKANLVSPALTGTPTAPTATSGTSSTQIATTAFVQSEVNGYLSKTGLTGGTVVLTAAEASNNVINLSGALTSNLIVELPTTAQRMYSVTNGTTGEFTTSIKVTGKTPTVLVAQGKRNIVYVNGLGAYDAINDFESIALTGTPTSTTPATGDRSTKIATTAMFSGEFMRSFAVNGYQKLPSGLIIQWGTTTAASAASGTSTVVTLPVAFVTACVTALATNTGAAAGNSTYNTTGKSTTSFTVQRGNNQNIETGASFNWFAIGY
jgi:hypothetical protein